MNIIYDAVGYFAVRGLLTGAGLGALYGTLVFPILGTLLGALYGGVVGYVGGSGCGLLAAIITRGLFYPLTNPLFYQWMLKICCAGVTLYIAHQGFGAITNSREFQWSILPSLIAAAAAIQVSGGFAARYSGDKPKNDKLKREDAGWQGIWW